MLGAGDVGYVIANMKSASEVKIGDTMTDTTHPCAEPLPGYKEIQPMVFSGIYPVDSVRLRGAQDGDGQAPDQRPRLHLSAGKLAPRSASVSAAASSACSTWKSSRSASAASSTWTSSPPIRRVIYRGHDDRRHRAASSTTRRFFPDPQGIQEIREPDRERLSSWSPANTSAT